MGVGYNQHDYHNGFVNDNRHNNRIWDSYIFVRKTPQMKSKIPIILRIVTHFLMTPNRPNCSTKADPTMTPTSDKPIVRPAPRVGIKMVIIKT